MDCCSQFGKPKKTYQYNVLVKGKPYIWQTEFDIRTIKQIPVPFYKRWFRFFLETIRKIFK